MIAAVPFRWLLTLTAMIAPFSAATRQVDRDCEEVTIRQATADHVMFRHYL